MNYNYKRARGSLFTALTGLLACGAVCAQGAAVAEPVAEATSTAPVTHFDVLEYRVLGNTVLAAKDVEAAVYPHLGPGKSFEDVEAARLALENAYRAAGRGTVFVDIPEQDVNEGVVRLKVTEGKLRQVRVQGARYFSGRSIKAALPATVAAVPDLPALQREIATLNLETADRSIVPVLSAGSMPGTVNLTLRVEDKLPLHAFVDVNDQYTADTSPTRASVGVSYDNLFGRLDSVSLQYQLAPEEPGELGVFVASYTRNLGAGKRWAVFFVDSDSDVAALGTLNVLGRGKVYGTRFILPFTSDGGASHSLTLGADYKDFIESIQLDTDSQFQTPISYLHFSLASTSTWNPAGQSLSFSPSANFGIHGFGNTNGVGEFADKRFHGRPNYFYLRAAVNYRSAPWHGFSLSASADGQYAVDPVIGNEQFTVGGADGVRGYLEAEVLGDMGYKAGLQLESPTWPLGFADSNLNAFLFYDTGRVSVVRPLPDEGRNESLSSWGAGVRLATFGHIDGSLIWANPLVQGSRTAPGDSRLLFRLRAAW